MAMSINAKMYADGAPLYYSAPWMRMLETHMAYLRARFADNVVNVEPQLAYKYEADLFGLLQQMKIGPQYHWLVMRLNDMTSPTQLRSDRESLILPDFREIEQLRSVYTSTRKKLL